MTTIASVTWKNIFGNVLSVGLIGFALSACGGGRGKEDSHSVGGTLSGLAIGSQLVLLDNNRDALSLSENGEFRFATTLDTGAAYLVTVSTQPEGQTCIVSGGAGTVATGPVNSVAVACSANPVHSIGGTVTGLLPGGVVVLKDDGSDTVTVTGNGSFTFAQQLTSGTSYAVTIDAPPVAQTCTVANGTGMVGAVDVSSVQVSCAAPGSTSLYRFQGGADGANPVAGLIVDAAGNLYGTTSEGGAHSAGTVFKIDANGTESILYAFRGNPGDGANPDAEVIRDASGNLYGTTYNGGTDGLGTVFKLAANGTETILHSFLDNLTDGTHPLAGLIQDSAGNLYGTTIGGGANGNGAVFKIDTSGNETILHSFTGSPDDGGAPDGRLLQDAAGNLYGTTGGGGPNNSRGTVFKLDTSGTETILHSFGSQGDGIGPQAGLILDAAGNLFGTTNSGGATNQGTVFKLDASGTETILHSFGSNPGDGVNPLGGALLRDAAGNLYGTTGGGGANGGGAVFKIDSSGNETVLYSFGSNPGDGTLPEAGLIQDAAGSLYGTTYLGGSNGLGTVFKIH